MNRRSRAPDAPERAAIFPQQVPLFPLRHHFHDELGDVGIALADLRFELDDREAQPCAPCGTLRENSERLLALHDARDVRLDVRRKLVFKPFAPSPLALSLLRDRGYDIR